MQIPSLTERDRTNLLRCNLMLRGGAPPKGGKGAKGAGKDAGAKATGTAKDGGAEGSRPDAPFPEARLEDIPNETGERHEFWVWCQNLKKEYEDGTRQISPELLQKKASSGKSLTVGFGKLQLHDVCRFSICEASNLYSHE